MPTALVAPEQKSALMGALAGGRAGLIVPILLGNAAIRAIAKCHGADLTGITIEDRPNYYAAFVFDPDGNNIEAVYRGEYYSANVSAG
jgi:hypothetical protein